jgi:hypothetical protein
VREFLSTSIAGGLSGGVVLRISSRVGATNSRLQFGSRRRRLGRLSAIASVAVAMPVTLLVMGAQGQPTAKADVPIVRPINVVRVTKVVKVKKVVRAPSPAPSF